MSRKSNAKRARARKQAMAKARAAGSACKFDDSQYEDLLYSATFDYNELSLARASTMLSPHGKTVVLTIAFASLACMLAALTIFKADIIVAIVPMCIALVSSTAVSNWQKIMARFASGTTLDMPIGGEKRHVVVCDNAVHTRSEFGESHDYDLSDLRFIRSNDDGLLMRFGKGEYVYVPCGALSEGRFRDAVRFLRNDEA